MAIYRNIPSWCCYLCCCCCFSTQLEERKKWLSFTWLKHLTIISKEIHLKHFISFRLRAGEMRRTRKWWWKKNSNHKHRNYLNTYRTIYFVLLLAEVLFCSRWFSFELPCWVTYSAHISRRNVGFFCCLSLFCNLFLRHRRRFVSVCHLIHQPRLMGSFSIHIRYTIMSEAKNSKEIERKNTEQFFACFV